MYNTKIVISLQKDLTLMNTLDFLKANEHKGKGEFLKEAQYLKDNWDWMKYSYAIAIKVRNRMNELGLTQKRLAESLGCTQQHISILLNGKVNMTLETLSKLEKALDFNLIGQALSLVDGYKVQNVTGYLNEPSSPEEAIATGTSSLVEGYTPRKKKGPKIKAK